ncbi:MAG TPA: O-antigen ligase family protein [Planctomycetaceae bacterium]
MVSRTRLPFVLAAMFILLSPLSVSTQETGKIVRVGKTSQVEVQPANGPAKYGRIAVTVLIVAFGLSSRGSFVAGPASKAICAWAALFVLSGIWSTAPHYALFHKSLFALVLLSGFTLVKCVRNLDELNRGLRFLSLFAGGAACVTFLAYLQGAAGGSTNGRMAMLGLNSNMLGMTAASLLILCAYAAINDPSLTVKRLMILPCLVLGIILIGSGSRGCALMALTGILFLALPLVRRPAVLAGLGLSLLITVYVAVEVLEVGGGNRLVKDLSKDTRGEVWRYVFKGYLKSPLIGTGWWTNNGTSWANTHNAYLQVLTESGPLGITLLALALFTMLRSWKRNHAWLRKCRLPLNLSYLTAALVVPVLLEGFAESGVFMGSGVNALFLGMGVGLLDRTIGLVTGSSSGAGASAGPPGGQVGGRPNRISVFPPIVQRRGFPNFPQQPGAA